MAIFGRRRSVEQTLELALGRIYEAQAKQVEALSGFLEKMSELSMRRAAAAMGQKGGRRTAMKKAEARAIAKAGKCPLCVDPSYRHVTVELIQQHRQHEAQLNQESEPRQEPQANGLDS